MIRLNVNAASEIWETVENGEEAATLETKVYHDKDLKMWHVREQRDFHHAHVHTNENAAVRARAHTQRHMCIISVVNLVSRNDLTKIVNMATYCERAKPQKSLPASLQKDKIDIEEEEKLKQDKGRGMLERRGAFCG